MPCLKPEVFIPRLAVRDPHIGKLIYTIFPFEQVDTKSAGPTVPYFNLVSICDCICTVTLVELLDLLVHCHYLFKEGLS